MSHSKNYILGVFDDEDVLMSAIPKIREAGTKIEEVYSPFPIHGIDDKLGIKRSRLPIAAFLFGLCGFSFAVWMQTYMLAFDWPMNIGGKPNFALPSFVPVSFELTVLIASLGMVGTFFVVSNLKPFAIPEPLDVRSTDDKFIMAIENNHIDIEAVITLLKSNGAIEVNHKEVK